MLMLLLGYRIIQKRVCKRDVIWPSGFGNFKVVFILLAKVVAVQMGIPIIEIEKSDLQGLLLKFRLDQSGKRSLILILVF